ncbi:MAG: hypothetical protein WCP18_03135 [bacterium]
MNSREYGGDKRAALGVYGTGDGALDEKIQHLHTNKPIETNFSDIYKSEEIKTDLQEVERIKQSPTYQKERTFEATRAEAVIVFCLSGRELLGKNSTGYLASEFDDIKKGTDAVAYMRNPLDPENMKTDLLLAIDITSSENDDILEEKLSKSIRRLDRKTQSPGNRGSCLTKLKYYKDDDRPKNELLNHYVVPISNFQSKEMADIITGKKKDERGAELELQIQTLFILRQQAYVQLTVALDKYTDLNRQEFSPYFNLSEEQKNNTDEILDLFTPENITWLKKLTTEQGVPEIWTSIEKNIQLVGYCDSLLEELVNTKKRASDIISRGSYDYGAQFISRMTRRSALNFF